MKIDESSTDEIAAMEMKGVLRRTTDGWVCECEGTDTGYGTTPTSAYHDWMRLLYRPYAPDEDAYDMVARDYLRLSDDL